MKRIIYLPSHSLHLLWRVFSASVGARTIDMVTQARSPFLPLVSIQSSTKLCWFLPPNVSRIPLFFPSPLPLLVWAPITSPQAATRVFLLFTPPSGSFPSELPSHCHQTVPGKMQLGKHHLPGEKPWVVLSTLKGKFQDVKLFMTWRSSPTNPWFSLSLLAILTSSVVFPGPPLLFNISMISLIYFGLKYLPSE